MRRLTGFLLLTGLLTLCQTALATYSIGDYVDYDFNLQAAQGGSYTLSQYEGEIVILNFFYTT